MKAAMAFLEVIWKLGRCPGKWPWRGVGKHTFSAVKGCDERGRYNHPGSWLLGGNGREDKAKSMSSSDSSTEVPLGSSTFLIALPGDSVGSLGSPFR